MTDQNGERFVRNLLETPIIRTALLRWRRQEFLSADGIDRYYGLFDSFESARAWLPANPEPDQSALEAMFASVSTKKVSADDYPVMWWLQHAFRASATKILDIGGSVGDHYYAYRRYVDMPSGLAWRIVDVPAIVLAGRRLAAAQRAVALEFCENLQRSTMEGDAEVWMSSGAIHYLDKARPSRLLERCATRPRHVLLNNLPLYGGQDYVTAQNIGTGSFAPIHVYNKGRYIRDIEALGYELQDEWPADERSLYLPGYPERSFPSFTGLYFSDRTAAKRQGKIAMLPPHPALPSR